jgi:hypothetical protein
LWQTAASRKASDLSAAKTHKAAQTRLQSPFLPQHKLTITEILESSAVAWYTRPPGTAHTRSPKESAIVYPKCFKALVRTAAGRVSAFYRICFRLPALLPLRIYMETLTSSHTNAPPQEGIDIVIPFRNSYYAAKQLKQSTNTIRMVQMHSFHNIE